VRHVSTLRLPAVSADLLKVEALKRRVPVSVLKADILNLWLYKAVDSRQTIYQELVPGCTPVDVAERYPGYLASLGFEPAVRVWREEHQSPAVAAIVEAPTEPVIEYRHSPKPPVTDRPAGDNDAGLRPDGYEFGLPKRLR
jgi:hypothetical protein